MIENLEPVTAVVAVIDDDKGIREALDGMLRSVGLQVECFASAQEFLAKDDRDKFGCIVLDVHLPGRNGLDFLDDLAALHVTTPVIVISGFADVPMSVRAMKAGAIEFLTKPVRAMDLLAAVEAAVKRDRATKQAAEKIAGLQADFETLTVREREVFAQCRRRLDEQADCGCAGPERGHDQAPPRHGDAQDAGELARRHRADG